MTPATGNTISTTSAGGTTNFFRMFRGGTEYGQLQCPSTNSHFLINAPQAGLRFMTQDTVRMGLREPGLATVNGFSVGYGGFMGLGSRAVTGTAPQVPWTRLHLHDFESGGGVVQLGFRPWMRNGTMMTGHGDQMFVGQKFGDGASDPTDAILQWSDNREDPQGPDLMRFVFTGGYTGAASGSHSLFGKEVMQLHPEGYIGLGDWNAAAATPSERLDVLDGKVRIRQLPGDAPTTDDKYVVVGSDGVLHWRNPGSSPDNCEWGLQSGSVFNVTTAWGSASGCPGDDNGVGIGLSNPDPTSKLQVRKFGGAGNEAAITAVAYGDGDALYAFGIQAQVDELSGDPGEVTHVGTWSVARSGTTQSYGVWAQASSDEENVRNIGCLASADGPALNTYGVLGHASGLNNSYGVMGAAVIFDSSDVGVDVHAVHGRLEGDLTRFPNAWAGYFTNRVFVDGPAYASSFNTPSDVTLKENVEPLEAPLATIAQLMPKRFTYRQTEHPGLNLPGGTQMGVIAQDLREVLPGLVKPVSSSAYRDSSGNVVYPAESYLAVDYLQLIPLLIAGMQEQQATIAELQQQVADVAQQRAELDALAAEVAGCCGAPGERRSALGVAPMAGGAADLRIAPNPFTDRTTVSYTVAKAGRVRLEVSGQEGRLVEVLREEKAQAGSFTYEWNTHGLAPGTYLVALLLDGQVVVKKAVKVDR